jgi:hypothetical protein
MNAKKLIITSALAASLTIGAATAFAQDDSAAETTPDAPLSQEMPGRFGDRNFEGRGPGGRFFGGPDGRDFGLRGGPRAGFGPGFDVAQELIEEYTGLEPAALREALRDGQTLAELIEANGQSVDAFIADAVAAGSERIDTAITDFTEHAETLRSTLEDRITARVNGERYQPPAAEESAEADA